MAHKPKFGKKRNALLKTMSLVLLVAALSFISFFAIRSLPHTAVSDNAQTGTTQQPTSTQTPTPPRSIHITAAGDLILHQRQLTDAKQADGSYDFSDYFTEVTPYLTDADLTFVTLETTLPGEGYRGYPLFLGPDSILDAMKSAGFDVVNTCTNHAFDSNWEGLVRTIDTVQDYGFYQTGTYKSAQDYHDPLIVETNGVKVGVIAYTKNVNGRDGAVTNEQHSFCIRFIANADYQADVEACRDKGADIVVAVMHWGYEYERTPRDSIRAEAEEMIRAGVDLVLGSHPHVVQPIEIMEVALDDGTMARGAVVYSMGNFISNQRDRYTDCGIIFNITFAEDEQGDFIIKDMSYLPTYVNRKTGYTDYRVLPVHSYMQNEALFGTLDDNNQDRLKRAWNDITSYLKAEPAVLVSGQ